MTKVYGGTVGKLLLGIRVVDLNYNKISWGRAILREILDRLISIIVFALGYLWVLGILKNKDGMIKLPALI